MSEVTKKKKGIEMVSGSLWKNIFLFSVPLMFTQVLEVLFNLSDVAVVGRFADYRALGSVGSTTLLVTLFTGFRHFICRISSPGPSHRWLRSCTSYTPGGKW